MYPPRRVLVVDDEPIVIRSCQRILSEQGYEVDATESGRQGLDRAFSEDFHLVMTDLKMPDLDGMEIVRTLRKNKPKTAVIVITGYGTIPSAVEATKLGVSDYLEKPFTPAQVTEAVDRALKGSKDRTYFDIEAEMVREVLRLATSQPTYGDTLLAQGSSALSGLSLSADAKAAILSGDIAWIEKTCGELSPAEREWLERRLQAEVW